MMLDVETMLSLYSRLCLCREFELALISYGTRDGVSAGHPYAGQEGVAAGVCTALQISDQVVSTHRSHGHAVAKGCDLDRLALELYGSADGLCRGRAGEMFVCQPDVGYFGGTQIVGGNLAMGSGLALSALLSQSNTVTVAFVGDGGVNQGVLYEVLNLAAIWGLPLIIVVEDNGYAQTTPTEYSTAGSIADRAESYGVAVSQVDGQMATDVYCAAASARERAVGGGGPAVIYARTYRYEGHYYGDRHRRYRTAAEVESWQARDPLEMHRQKLSDFGIDQGTIVGISETAKRRSAEAFDRARAGRPIVMADILDDLVADPWSGELRR